MNIHLTELELVAATQLGGDSSAQARQHLAACAECRAACEQVSALRVRMADTVDAAADQPEAFWLRQQAAIRNRMVQSNAPATVPRASAALLVWLATATLATFLAAGTLVWNVIHRGVNQPSVHVVQPVVPNGVQQNSDADHEMLIAIEQDMDYGVTDALQPAVGLVSEVSQAQARRRSTPKISAKQKEKRP